MSQKKTKPEDDQEILARLRRPIDDLVDQYCADKTEYQRMRLRQLAWQAVDVLARIGDQANLEYNSNIARLIRDIKQLGASDQFIEESLDLAGSIYKKMKVYYPGLLKRYSG